MSRRSNECDMVVCRGLRHCAYPSWLGYIILHNNRRHSFRSPALQTDEVGTPTIRQISKQIHPLKTGNSVSSINLHKVVNAFIFTKYSIIIILLELLLSSCSTPEEQRLNAINSLLSDTIEREKSIKIIKVDYDSIYSTQRNIEHINTVKEIVLLRDSTIDLLKEFKTNYTDNNCRVWLKNVNDGINSSLTKIRHNTDKMQSLIVDLASTCNTDPMIGNPQQSIVLQYKANDVTKYGLFIFTENNDISDFITLSEDEYTSINAFLAKAQGNALQYVPTFEMMGIDIVPEDEDPSKSK